MTDFVSLSPPCSVYTAIPDGDLSLWQSLTTVNSKQCRYELRTQASIGSDASSVFKAFRNLQALSHSVQGSTLSLYCHTHTYLDPGPAKQHGSFTKPKPLSSLSSTSWKHKKRATLSAGRKEQEPASCDLLRSGTTAALWQMLPFSPQSSRKIADSRHWGADRPKVRGGSQCENLLWFLQAPTPPHTHKNVYQGRGVWWGLFWSSQLLQYWSMMIMTWIQWGKLLKWQQGATGNRKDNGKSYNCANFQVFWIGI